METKVIYEEAELAGEFQGDFVPPPGTTVQEFDMFLKNLRAKMDAADLVDAQLSEMNKEVSALKSRAAQMLEEMGRKNFKSPYGMLTRKEHWKHANPQGDVAKKLFIDWLTEKGLFMQYVTVNNNSLNSLLKTELVNAQKLGQMDFLPPGIEAAKLHTTILFPKK